MHKREISHDKEGSQTVEPISLLLTLMGTNRSPMRTSLYPPRGSVPDDLSTFHQVLYIKCSIAPHIATLSTKLLIHEPLGRHPSCIQTLALNPTQHSQSERPNSFSKRWCSGYQSRHHGQKSPDPQSPLAASISKTRQ